MNREIKEHLQQLLFDITNQKVRAALEIIIRELSSMDSKIKAINKSETLNSNLNHNDKVF